MLNDGVAIVLYEILLVGAMGTSLTVAVAYGSFVLSEGIVGASGVMATVAAGIAMGGMLESRAGESVRDLLRELWESLGFIANALLFLFIGLALDFQLIRDNLAPTGIGIAAVLISTSRRLTPTISWCART
ncbi:MAG: hypothetical protein GEU86_14870 [Actinophytocola sp.]|nr:hypothetical protein [Actinophytocola sp.]